MENYKTAYDTNETMQLLGKQYANTFFDQDVFKQLDDILAARKGGNIKDICIDVYMLGVINGQRKEREKKHDRQKNTGTGA